jgi:hypothetical protein
MPKRKPGYLVAAVACLLLALQVTSSAWQLRANIALRADASQQFGYAATLVVIPLLLYVGAIKLYLRSRPPGEG